MPLYSFEGVTPKVHDDAWIAPNATLVGDVTVEAGASVWYGAVLRADFNAIVIRAGANVQDNSVIHCGYDPVTEVGVGATIGHMCVVHGCTIGVEALIGNHATVQDGAKIGDRALVAAGALVPPNTVVEPGTMFLGPVGQQRGPLSSGAARWVDNNAEIYQDLARRHKNGARPI